MKGIKTAVIIMLMAFLAISCTTGTDITKKNNDGSPIWTTEIPQSNRLIYGVGSAKFSTDANSRDASYSNAVADLARKISVRIKDASASYVSDTSEKVSEAYENIRVMTVNITMKGVKAVERWKAQDGTVWTLVSFAVKDLPELYADAANSYKAQQEERRLDILSRYNALMEENMKKGNENASEILEMAKERSAEMISEIEYVKDAIKADEVAENIISGLEKDGYDLSEAEE